MNSSALSLLYGPAFTSVHDYWKDHSFDSMDLCWQSDVFGFIFIFFIFHVRKVMCRCRSKVWREAHITQQREHPIIMLMNYKRIRCLCFLIHCIRKLRHRVLNSLLVVNFVKPVTGFWALTAVLSCFSVKCDAILMSMPLSYLGIELIKWMPWLYSLFTVLIYPCKCIKTYI